MATPLRLAALLSLASAHALASDDVDARLAKGEVLVRSEKVEGADMPVTHALGVVNAPPEKVWAIVSDCNNFTKNLPRIAEAKELERKGDTVVCRVVTKLPFPLKNLAGVTRAVHEVSAGERWTRTWDLIEGDYEYNRGAWTLTPFAGDPKRTLVRYRIHVQPKISVPSSLIRHSQTRALPELYERLRSASGATER